MFDIINSYLKHLSGLYYVHLLETRTNRLKTNACANNGSD